MESDETRCEINCYRDPVKGERGITLQESGTGMLSSSGSASAECIVSSAFEFFPTALERAAQKPRETRKTFPSLASKPEEQVPHPNWLIEHTSR